MTDRQRFSLILRIEDQVPDACAYLADQSGLAKARIKDAMNKGAVWHTARGKRRALRRATAALAHGDTLELHYDAALLALRPPPARCIDDHRRYSVWLKPAGLLAQGTHYGDHCSLLRQVELHFAPRRPALAVHRLDREAAGLVLVAHDSDAAARLSALFRDHAIEKRYRVQVRGKPPTDAGTVTAPLDGKPAITHYRLEAYDAATDSATLAVRIDTGRLHQIRRHLDLLGCPVLGDPRYGTGNKNAEGLQLQAVGLRFMCPFGGGERTYDASTDLDDLQRAEPPQRAS